MNVFLIILLILGGILVFFIPAIKESLTDTQMKHVKGRTYAFVKEKEYVDTEEGMALQSIVSVLEKDGIGPYSNSGLFKIRLIMNKTVPDLYKTMEYSDDNIKIMLKRIGIEENAHTKRAKMLNGNFYNSAHKWLQDQIPTNSSPNANVEQE